MKKLLLASAVSALFAAPTAVLAQAAPAPAAPAAPTAPTLDKVLEASGISLSGYVDVAYEAANRNIDPSVANTGGVGGTGLNNRVFDWQRNSFVLHQVGLTAAKQPKEGFGGLLNITAGRDATVIHSFDTAAGQTITDTMFDVTQAFGQWATGPLTIIAGKFTTLHGTEVIASTGNTNFSRSMLFGAVPFTHTGVRGTYVVNDMLSLTGGVNNGWDQVRDMNKGKTIELMATITPVKPLTIVLSDMTGKEIVLPTAPSTFNNPAWTIAAPYAALNAFANVREGNRNSFNAVATWTVNDALSIGVEGLAVSQELAAPAGTTGRYNGFAGYLTYMFTPQWRGVLRAETFNDKDGMHFGVPNAKYGEWTLTASYLPNSSFEIRGEVRRDRSSSPSSNTVAGVNYSNFANGVFVSDTGTVSRDLTTFAIQALYKF